VLQAAKRTQWVYVWQLSARRAAVIGAHAALDATEWGALEAERDWSDFALNLAFMTAVYLYFSDAGPRVRPPPPAPLRWARGCRSSLLNHSQSFPVCHSYTDTAVLTDLVPVCT